VRKMSYLNMRILETIENGDYPENVKFLLKALLEIELRNIGDKRPRFSEDYDRIIKKFAKSSEY